MIPTLRPFIRHTTLGAALCLGLTAGHAQAAGYVLLEGGLGEADLSTQSFEDAAAAWRTTPTATGASVSDDERDSLWRIGAGYAFSDRLAIEIFYEDLGGYEGAMTLTGTDADGESAALDAQERVALEGVGARLVGQWPLSANVRLLGMAGLSYLEQQREYQARVTNFDAPTRAGHEREDERDWVPTLGLGVSMALTDRVVLRGHYTRYFDAARTENLPTFDVDSLSIGLGWQW